MTNAKGMLTWRRFHGINPSKNKQDKRFKKIAEEREKKKRLMGGGDDEDNPTARMHAVQEQTATPYLVRLHVILMMFAAAFRSAANRAPGVPDDTPGHHWLGLPAALTVRSGAHHQRG